MLESNADTPLPLGSYTCYLCYLRYEVRLEAFLISCGQGTATVNVSVEDVVGSWPEAGCVVFACAAANKIILYTYSSQSLEKNPSVLNQCLSEGQLFMFNVFS